MASEELAARPRGAEGGGRIILLAGLGLGVLAAILIAVILSGSGGEEKVVPATRVAVVAAQDIPARTRLTREMLTTKTYNIDEVDADAFTTVGQLVNRVTAADVKAGSPILPSAVSTSTGEGLTFAVSPGMRAVSINVNEVVTAGGNISPGNRVDIIGVFQIARGGDVSSLLSQFTGEPAPPLVVPQDARVTFTLLQNVKVLAVAQNLPPEASQPTGETQRTGAFLEADRPNPRASTVTLEVTPQQAQIMSIADLQGELRLALRPFGEDARAQVVPIVTLIED